MSESGSCQVGSCNKPTCILDEHAKTEEGEVGKKRVIE